MHLSNDLRARRFSTLEHQMQRSLINHLEEEEDSVVYVLHVPHLKFNLNEAFFEE